MKQFLCFRAIVFRLSMGASVISALLLLRTQPAIAQTNTAQIDARKFVAAAERYVGKKVGDGGCSRFADQVLKDMKGQPLVLRPKNAAERAKEKDLGYKLPEEISIWGDRPPNVLGKRTTPVAPNYKAGEILQFENCYFEKKRADGSLERNWDFPHHTAIIKSANGSVVTILHQNAPLGSKVHEEVLDLSLLTPKKDGTKGTLTTFIPKKQ